MAIPFLNNINLSDNELQNAKLHVTSGTPTEATGQIYYNSSSNVVLVYDNAGWETVAFQSWATNQFLEDSEVSAFAKTILDDSSAAAVRTTIGVDAAGTDNSTDVTLATVANNYLSISGQAITAGTVPISLGGTGATTAAAARTALGVDAAGTDNSTNVSLAGSYDYITAGGTDNQTLTLGQITNADLENSSITVNGSAISLGGSVNTLQLGTTATTALAGNTTVDDVSIENLKTALAGGFSSNAVQIGDSSDTVTIPGDLIVTGTTITNNVETVSTSSGVIFEGTTADGNDGTLVSTVAGSSKTYTLPNLTGHVALFSTAPTATITSTPAELNILDGATVTTSELNILDGVTATASELNILDGVTSTTAELNILDGVTSTTAELNILDGVTATASEINLLDGVTSLAHVGKKTKKISGDGTNTTFSVSHGLNTALVSVEILDYGDNGTGATYERVFADVIATSGSETSSIDVSFGTAPSTTQDYVVLISSFPAIS